MPVWLYLSACPSPWRMERGLELMFLCSSPLKGKGSWVLTLLQHLLLARDGAVFPLACTNSLSTISLPSPLYSPLISTVLKWKWPVLILFYEMLSQKSINRFYATWCFSKLMHLSKHGSLTWAGLCRACWNVQVIKTVTSRRQGRYRQIRVGTSTVLAGDGVNYK